MVKTEFHASVSMLINDSKTTKKCVCYEDSSQPSRYAFCVLCSLHIHTENFYLINSNIHPYTLIEDGWKNIRSNANTHGDRAKAEWKHYGKI